MLNLKLFSFFFTLTLSMMLTGCGSGGGSSTTGVSSTGVLTSITVVPVNQSIAADTHRQFTATGTYSNNTSKDLTNLVAWNSSNTSSATVSNSSSTKGLVAALSTAGSTTISASYGGKTGSTRLDVTSATLVSIAVTPANQSISNGTTLQFRATGTFSNNSTQDITSSVIWSSATSSVATISDTLGSKGLATARAAGSSTITATYGARTGTASLTVTAVTLTSITVTPSNSSISVGSDQQFIATGTFSNGTSQDITASVSWTSSNTGVATISNIAGSKGLVSADAAGTTTIIATLGGIQEAATLTVVGNGTISLTWNAPTQYADGSPLDPAADLQSYKLYYGTASHTYTQAQTMTFVNPGTSSITQSVTLAQGTYFFVVTAVTQDNLESGHSNEISRTIY